MNEYTVQELPRPCWSDYVCYRIIEESTGNPLNDEVFESWPTYKDLINSLQKVQLNEQ